MRLEQLRNTMGVHLALDVYVNRLSSLVSAFWWGCTYRGNARLNPGSLSHTDYQHCHEAYPADIRLHWVDFAGYLFRVPSTDSFTVSN